MRLEFDRLDIHMGDNSRSRRFEVDPSCTTLKALEMIATHVPQIAGGWVIRAQVEGAWRNLGTCGSTAAPVTVEMPDVPLQSFAQGDAVQMFGIPAREAKAS